MSSPILGVLFVLFICAALLLLINLTGDPGIDYWDLDGENEPSASKLDVLRNKPTIYGATAVLVGTFIAYLWAYH